MFRTKTEKIFDDWIYGFKENIDPRYRPHEKTLEILVNPSLYEQNREKMFVSLLPDEVVEYMDDYNIKLFYGCILFGDISGFTDLTEKYGQQGRGGASRLTLLLNSFIGKIIQEIMCFGGDILKFSGDAFLALFKCKEDVGIMKDYVHQALDCALIIQSTFGQFQTEDKSILTVKLGIAAGEVYFSLIGNEKFSHYMLLGKAVLDVKQAESQCKAGEIIVSLSAWSYANFEDYSYVEHDENFIKLLGVGEGWSHDNWEITRSGIYQRSIIRANDYETFARLKPFERLKFIRKTALEFTLRKVMYINLDIEGKNVRKFIMAQVAECIDRGEPFEYMTEMRTTTVMFVNILQKIDNNIELISFIDKCYIEICETTDKYLGCVNKVSLFDKDLMFVVIFGLKNLKHDLECHFALKCANAIYTKLKNYKLLHSISIACTTGKTYCGIVGHTLRKEYTVMGIPVNKAARIMVNYPDMIACDTVTFLNSNMATQHFHALPRKELKGIRNPGAIYKFVLLSNVVEECAVTLSRYYPLLGREDEMGALLEALDSFLENFDKDDAPVKMMVIKGFTRQGKTRLLEEFLQLISQEVFIAKVSMIEEYSTINYHCIKLILLQVLRLEEKSTKEEIMDKLLLVIDEKYHEYMCLFNDIFGVDFEMNDSLEKISLETYEQYVQDYVLILCYSVVFDVWIVAVDQSIFIDEKSWQIYFKLLGTNLFFYIITLDTHLNLTKGLEELLKNPKVHDVELSNLSRSNHSAFACQILNVFALPIDLEYLLQNRSNGNPGWIECCVISLKLLSDISICERSWEKIYHDGLYTPPLYMLKRLSPENAFKWKQIMEERSYQTEPKDKWYRYIDACRDKGMESTLRGKIHRLVDEYQKYPNLKENTDSSSKMNIPVCYILNENCFENISSEMSNEVQLLKAYDTLTYSEQVFLKYSSVLGDSCPRVMLFSIMDTSDNYRQISQVIQSLFEKRIICCAEGDFIQGFSYLLVRKRISDIRYDSVVTCNCIGLEIHEEVQDLPKYASCGHFCFVSSSFREIIYDLLTDNQKKIFHSHAMKYLLKETRKCPSCEEAESLSNAEYDTARKKMMNFVKIPSIFLQTDAENGSTNSRRRRIMKSMIGGWDSKSVIVDEEMDQYYTQKLSMMNPLKVLKYRMNYTLIKPFRNFDFKFCQCYAIKLYVFNQLIYHYRSSSSWIEMIFVLMEYIDICIYLKNYFEAFNSLRNTLEYLGKYAYMTIFSADKICLLQGKLFSSYGGILEALNQTDEAVSWFMIALKRFGIIFPKHNLKFKMKFMKKILFQKLRICFAPDYYVKRKFSVEKNKIEDQKSFCFNKMFDIFIQKGEKEKALLCAFWGLSVALKADMDMSNICQAFSNTMLMVSTDRSRFWSALVEVHALRFCHRKTDVDALELEAVLKMYYVIFEIRLLKAEFENASNMGYILRKLSYNTKNFYQIIKINTNLLLILLVGLNFHKYILMLQELLYVMHKFKSSTIRAAYYSNALLLHLETGYNIVYMSEIEDYYYENCMNKPCINQRKFLVLLRAWYSRINNWSAANMVNEQVKITPGRVDSTEKLLGMGISLQGLYEQEYLLMLLVRTINEKNFSRKKLIKKKIKDVWKVLETYIRSIPIIRPRYHIMRAYEAIIHRDVKLMTKHLKLTRTYAFKQKNYLNYYYALFLEEFWNNNLKPEESSLWEYHTRPGNHIDYDREVHGRKMMSYPLPIPEIL